MNKTPKRRKPHKPEISKLKEILGCDTDKELQKKLKIASFSTMAALKNKIPTKMRVMIKIIILQNEIMSDYQREVFREHLGGHLGGDLGDSV